MTASEPYAQLDDAALATKAKSGDRRAFEVLMQRHGQKMMNIAWRSLGDRPSAEDAVQDAMASAWFKLRQYDIARPFAAWVSRITLNKCRDQARRRKIGRIFDFGADNEIEHLPSEEAGAHDLAYASELSTAMNQEVSALPSKLREPFVLVTFDGCTHAAAADLLGITPKAIETRIYRARQRLRIKLRKFEG